ncbi:MAG TPA: hypothetical protein VH092_25005 [Urbifossiella sp.]|jgi:hypothetical protein|nr:hypothetical protein [Urbifossiella sp.]
MHAKVLETWSYLPDGQPQHREKGHLDDRVPATVNPFNGEGGEATLVLSQTGSRVRVNMAEWERWLEAPTISEGEQLHPLVVAELREAVPALKAAIPTADAAMDALDGESKGWTRGGSEEAEPGAAADGHPSGDS